MAQFIVHKDESEKKAGSRRVNEGGYSSFWVPFAIVIAGALIASAVIFKDRLAPVAPSKNGVAANDVAPAALTPNSPTPTAVPTNLKPDLSDAPMLGEATASVTMVEFSDFQCPYCGQYFQQSFKQIEDNYINTGKVKYYYKDFPLKQIHPNAQKAAEAANCADAQKKFWPYHDLLLTKQAEWAAVTDPTSLFSGYSASLGLNQAAFTGCLTSGQMTAKVDANEAEALKLQVGSTPSFIINGQLVVGAYPYAEFQKILDPLIK